MKQIKLTQGKIALVDNEDFERINQYKWFAHRRKSGKVYAARNSGVFPFRRTVLMHREILDAPDGFEVDHINPDGTLDNRRANLRICTRSENQHNRPKYASNKSGFKGVSWHPECRKWQARIAVGGKLLYLGVYEDIEIAARVYDDAARQYHGQFARTNF